MIRKLFQMISNREGASSYLSMSWIQMSLCMHLSDKRVFRRHDLKYSYKGWHGE